jgi:hypothetical protein
VRVDLRLGTARRASTARLTAITAAGGTFYGVDSGGAVTRLTTAGEPWRVRLSPAPQALLPQRDGTVLAAGSRGGTGVLWVLRPPAAGATDSVRVPGGARPVGLAASDRVYFAGGDELLAVQARTLAAAAPIALGAELRAAAASPSGDRLYVLTARPGELQVVDRYAGAVRATLRLPGAAREIRVDPLGRYLLVRPERGDSAWVVAAGTDRVLGQRRRRVARGPPGGAPGRHGTHGRRSRRGARRRRDAARARPRGARGGGLLAARAVERVPSAGGRARPAGGLRAGRAGRRASGRHRGRRHRGGRGRRARAGSRGGAGRHPPAAPAAPSGRARPPDGPAPDGAGAARGGRVRAAAGTLVVRGAAAGEVAFDPAEVAQAGPARGRRVYTVQFAAAPTEREARRTLGRLRLGDPTLRVVPKTFDGRTVYRVVAGPYPTRARADEAGRAVGAGNYWVYEGAP